MKNYVVYLHSIWVTQNKLFELWEKNIDFKEFYESLNFDLLKQNWFISSSISRILENKNKFVTKKIDETLQKLDVKLILYWEEDYPKNLAQISKPPFLLYIRGEIKSNNYFSIIWARKMKKYALKAWELIIPDLVNYFTIVSGWAWWCDSLAHKITLEKKGKTIVVFWTWIDVCYPEINREMYENIINFWGWLLSIFPIWTIWSNFTFPIRNEIVSWISSWVLILQAQKKSWTLITANLALEQSRDLFCVSWDIFSPDFEWCNDLIKSWSAKLITNSEDILEEYNLKIIPKNKKVPIFDTQIEADIFELLKYNLSLNVDEILEKTNYNYAEITLNLSSLELSWIIKKDLFWKYEIIF